MSDAPPRDGATPHDVFRAVVEATGDRVAAIRTVRERFGLGLGQAKEVMLQAEGSDSSLGEYQDRIADELERGLRESEPREDGSARGDQD